MEKKNIFEKKNVLVLGGAGFIGSHLCDQLTKTAKVICLDNFSTGEERNIDHLLAETNFKFIRHDISEPIDLAKLPELEQFDIKYQGVQEIYNLACPTSPLNFNKNKIAILSANSLGVKNSLDLAVKYKAKYLLFSSAVVYGPRRKDNLKISEEDIGQVDLLSERSAYDEGKRFAETITVNYQEVFKLEAKIMRLFRVYGPRMKLNDQQMIPDFISNALDNKDLIIYGESDFSSSFCYVSDVLDAAIKMMDRAGKRPLNIGSDVEIKLTEVAEKIIKLTASNSKIVFGQKTLFMTPQAIPNISKAKEEMGWLPLITLDKGLEKTIYDLRASKGLKSIKEVV